MNKPAIDQNSVVLVSGGARGITAQCVKQLAQEYPCKYILLGRSSLDNELPEWTITSENDADLKQQIMSDIASQGKKPTPAAVDRQFKQIRAQQEIENTLSTLTQNGARVEYIPVDISDKEKLQESLIEPVRRFGRITGVIHGAGTLADKRIEKKTADDFESVISPKVDGLRNLFTVAPAANLDFLVLFSSIVGVFGNIGQTDYAIANEVLNKTAYQVKRENPECRVLSINWGPWDSGMVTPELKKAFADRNMAVIPASAGAEMLVGLLSSDRVISKEPVQVIVGAIPTRMAGEVTPDLHTYIIHRKLELDKNPFLQDHCIGNNPVLPATCAASWAASACEQLYPGYTFSNIEDFKVLKGIVFDETLAREHTLELTEIAKTPEGRVSFKAVITSNNSKGRPIYHYSLGVELEKNNPPIPKHTFDLPSLAGDQQVIPGSKLYEDGTLFHGPSFQGVQKVLSISEGRIILECNLPAIPPEQQGQFPLQTSNPFIYDAIVQSLLIWSQRFYQSPCLPSHLMRLDQFKAIPFDQTCLVDMQIVSHSATNVVADIYVTDPSGNVYVIFHKLQGTISPLLKRFIGTKAVSGE
jgi:NAD(P)-dependent dehydrogenase (short-subunit alcohol dehydrogenase family)